VLLGTSQAVSSDWPNI